MKKILSLIVKLLMVALSITCVASFPIYAWFSKADRNAHIGEVEINIPPEIYIKNDDLLDMTSFDLDGLQIDVEYNFIFCVTPVQRDVVRDFLIGAIYTENIGMIIDIFPISSITTSAGANYEVRQIQDPYNSNALTDIYFNYDASYDWSTNKKVSYGNENTNDLNRGVYKTYHGMKFTKSTSSWNKSSYESLQELLSDHSHYVFFNLKITWKPKDQRPSNTNKEVDIVYITTKGTSSE